jgi:hypothetical protein
MVPVMLTDVLEVEDGQGADPERVRLPFESVPVKLKVVEFSESLIVPVSTLPVCERVT